MSDELNIGRMQSLEKRLQKLRQLIFLQSNLEDVPGELEDHLHALEAELAKTKKQKLKEEITGKPSNSRSSRIASSRGIRKDLPKDKQFAQPKRLIASTTGLDVEYEITMEPIPTGVYHLLHPLEDPLVNLTVKYNKVSTDSPDMARVRVTCFLEGISSQDVKSFELEDGKSKQLKLLPTILPEKARLICEIQRATLHVIVEDLDGRLECHNSEVVTMLARNSGLNSIVDPQTGQTKDLTKYYGAWVTPHADDVLLLLRKAAERVKRKQIIGYFGKDGEVEEQVQALFDTLKDVGIVYINSVIDFGTGAEFHSQRTRLPRESIKQQSANCLDGALLFASLLEAATLSAAIVLVPGHAYVGWRTGPNDDDKWAFLETTMIGGSTSFEAACKRGTKLHQDAQVQKDLEPDSVIFHELENLREQGIYPME